MSGTSGTVILIHKESEIEKKIQKDIDKIGQQKWFDHSGEAKIMWEIWQWEKISQQIELD